MSPEASRGGKAETLSSIDDARPRDEGGTLARSGFNYQDEIAVTFLISMLETPAILKVHCESHDDVVLVRVVEGSTQRVAEYVQVKASEPDSLWSLAGLCARKAGKPGSSIFEISLARDKHLERSCFRLVTLRPVVNALEILTFPCGAPGRGVAGDRFQILRSELDERFPGLKSPKGNGSAYWLENCFWEQRHSEEAVRKDNLLRVIRLSASEGLPLLPEPAEILVDNLRGLAKAAGSARWEPDRSKKIITREALRSWWEGQAREQVEGAPATGGGKLRDKMIEAGLPAELVELAVDMRRDYASIARTSRYMEADERARLQRLAKSELVSLRARFVAGQLDLDGLGFHALCLDRMDAINTRVGTRSEDRSAFLKGCMYDIADRCLLRFVRPTS